MFVQFSVLIARLSARSSLSSDDACSRSRGLMDLGTAWYAIQYATSLSVTLGCSVIRSSESLDSASAVFFSASSVLDCEMVCLQPHRPPLDTSWGPGPC